MNLIKKLCCGALALLLVLGTAGCAQLPDEPLPEATPSPAVTAKPAQPAGPYKIGLVQWQEDPTLDAVREALTARLEEWAFPASALTLESLQAGGNEDNARQICEDLSARKYSLIIGLGAPAAKIAAETAGAAGSATQALAVTLGVTPQELGVTYPDSPEGSVTGVTVRLGILDQLELLQAAVPGLKTVGLLTREKGMLPEDSINTLKENAAARKIDVVVATLPETGADAGAKAAELAGQVQGVLAPEGSLTASQGEAVGKALLAAKKPWIAGSEALVEQGALASVAVSPLIIGKAAADMAVELAAGKQLSQVPFQTLQETETVLNQALVETLHIQLPQETQDAAVYVSALPVLPTPTPEPTPAPEEEEEYDDEDYYEDDYYE